MARDDGSKPSVLLKQAALLFDQLLLRPYGIPRGDYWPQGSFGWFIQIATEDPDERSYLEESGDLKPILTYTENLSDDLLKLYEQIHGESGGETWLSKAAEWVEPQLRAEFGIAPGDAVPPALRSEFRYQYKGRVGDLATEAALFTIGVQLFDDAAALTSDSFQAFYSKAMATAHLQPATPLLVPDCSRLTWPDVLSLRDRTDWNEFRAVVARLNAAVATRGISASQALVEEVAEAGAAIDAGTGAHPVRTLLGNMPLPTPINPLGVMTALLDERDRRKLRQRTGWLMFLNAAQRRARP